MEEDTQLVEEVIEPSEEYLQQSLVPSMTTPERQPQLLILDLNGTLCSRTKAKTAFFARPHCPSFFDFIFKTFTVMVWSSAQEKSVKRMCKIFHPHEPVATWDRSHFNLSESEFHSDADTLKDLDLIWNNILQFNATNTIVLDDSTYKLSAQPYNLMKMSTFDHTTLIKNVKMVDRDLWKAANYLLQLSHETNVSNFMRNQPFDVKLEYGTMTTKVDRDCGHYINGQIALKQKKSIIPPELENRDDIVYENAFAIVLPDGTTAGERPAKKIRTRSKNTTTEPNNEADVPPNSEVAAESSPKKRKKKNKNKDEEEEEELENKIENIQPNPLEYLFMQAIGETRVKSKQEEHMEVETEAEEMDQANGNNHVQEMDQVNGNIYHVELMEQDENTGVEYEQYEEDQLEEGEYLDEQIHDSNVVMPNPLESFYNSAFNVQPIPRTVKPVHSSRTIFLKKGETPGQAILRHKKEKRKAKLIAKKQVVVSAGQHQKKAKKRKVKKEAKAAAGGAKKKKSKN